MLINDKNGDAIRVKYMVHFIAVVLCVLTKSVFAESYYVSKDNGSDNNSGLSWVSAWRTIQHAAHHVKPGDIVTIKHSKYPYNPIVISESGKPNLPITFQGESKLDLPVITGDRLVSDWSQQGTGNIWATKISTMPSLVIEDESSLKKADNELQINKGQWYWKTGLLYYRPNKESPFDHTIRVSVKAGGIKIINTSWVVIKNLKMELGKGAGIELKNSNHVVIDNAWVKWHWQGIRISSKSNNNIVTNSHVEENREGIYITGESSNNSITNSKAFRNGNPPYWHEGDRGGILIGEKGPNINNKIEECEVAYNGGPNSDPAVIAYQAPHTKISHNNIHDNYGSGLFITIWSNDSIVEYNRIINNGVMAVASGYKGISGLSIRRSKRALVQSNIILNNHVSPDSRWPGKDLGPKGGLDIQGNSNDTMENIRIIRNTVTGTIGGPDLYFSKIPKTPGLIVE